jgi:hypothetical protein
LLGVFFLVGRHMTAVVGWFVVEGTFFFFSSFLFHPLEIRVGYSKFQSCPFIY